MDGASGPPVRASPTTLACISSFSLATAILESRISSQELTKNKQERKRARDEKLVDEDPEEMKYKVRPTVVVATFVLEETHVLQYL